jgi:hypothetical protein
LIHVYGDFMGAADLFALLMQGGKGVRCLLLHLAHDSSAVVDGGCGFFGFPDGVSFELRHALVLQRSSSRVSCAAIVLLERIGAARRDSRDGHGDGGESSCCSADEDEEEEDEDEEEDDDEEEEEGKKKIAGKWKLII